MDPESFLEIANQVTKLKMFPYFEIAHCVISCLYMREDLGQGSHPFSRKHPFACWISCMVSIFSGAILANLLLGEPILGAFKNSNQLLLATAVWYLMFYSPFDAVYKACKFMPFKVVFAAMKEVIRCKKVHDGVVHAAKIYPNGFIIMVAVGTIKGNGAAFLKLVERILRGVWTPNAIEFLAPTFPTKACIAASIIFIIDRKTDWISVPHALVYFGIVIFFVYFKLSSILLGIHDPFVPFENLFCAIFMGGIWDALSHVIANAKNSGDNNPKVEIPRREETKKKD
ncbi:trimeric intracellular cation channel type A-like protein [Leptotrombidium deliense]|uniref:Trimeric intracellular cation channel type A-like protein n=1 Tax=Leptotrombidium deliense TaxID=299467 RepID=A0A443SIE1_9ACAR|nr:trimeric intracellular cation channel type A-like protein [Leptotrombidium deliense]